MLRTAFALAVALLLGCGRKAPPPAPPQPGPDLTNAVARVGDTVITVDDMQAQINAQPPAQRARYAEDRGKKDFLDNVVRQTVLGNEARAHGLDKHPDVQRVARERMIALFVQQEVDGKIKVQDIPDAEVEKYYREHAAEFTRPGASRPLDQVREELRQRLHLIARSRKMEALLSELRGRTRIELFQERLARVSVGGPDTPPLP